MILWLFLTWGMALVIANSVIAAPLRRRLSFGRPALEHFWRCPMCVGFWVGLGLGLAGLGPAGPLSWPLPLRALADAFCSAGWCWTVHVTLMKLGAGNL